jgi:hypothetical protein
MRLWNVKCFRIVKNDKFYENVRLIWIKQAKSILKEDPVTIINKNKFVSDGHLYVSVVPY